MKTTDRTIALGGLAFVGAIAGLYLVLAGSPQPSTTGPGAPTAGLPATVDAETDSAAAVDKDFLGLVKDAMRIENADERETVLAGLFSEWLGVDPIGFGQYVMMLEVKGQKARLDIVAKALQKALETMPTDVASSAAVQNEVRRVGLHLARTDPDAAIAWVDRWLQGEPQQEVMVPIARTLALRNPREALQYTGRILSPLRKMQAYAWVAGIWARTDPKAAVAWASAFPQPATRAMAMNTVLSAMAQQDPDVAAAQLATTEQTMADEYHDKWEAELAAMGLKEEDFANDPESFREKLEGGEIPPPTSGDVELMADAARLIGSELAAENPAAGIEWAEGIENDFLRQSAVKGALAGWSASEPAAAAAYAAKHFGDNGAMLAIVYETWADDAPAAAAKGTQLIQDPLLHAKAIETVADAWALSNPAAAAAWVDSLPAGDRTDAVQFAVAAGLATVNPVAAWNRAQVIQDPTLQFRGLKAALTEMVMTRPEGAASLLASANLPAETTARLQYLVGSTENS